MGPGVEVVRKDIGTASKVDQTPKSGTLVETAQGIGILLRETLPIPAGTPLILEIRSLEDVKERFLCLPGEKETDCHSIKELVFKKADSWG